jgi:hypothetical protein
VARWGNYAAERLVSRFLAGKRNLTLRTADKLAGYLGLELRHQRKVKGK